MPRIPKRPIVAYHVNGDRACGGPAFGVTARHPLPDIGTFPADNVVLLDGTQPLRGAVPVCGSCGALLDSFGELSYSNVRTPAPERRIA